MPIDCFVLCVVVSSSCAFFRPRNLTRGPSFRKKKRKNITHVRVVSRDVVKTVTGRRKKMQKNTQPKERAFLFCVNTTTTVHTSALWFQRHPQKKKITSLYLLKRQSLHEKSATMKRLFGVKKTVEAPSLEDTTSKVRLLSRSLFLALALALFFSLAVCARARVCGESRLGSFELTIE